MLERIQINEDELKKVYYANLSLTEIGRIFGCSKTTINKRVKKIGLPQRDVDTAWRTIRWTERHKQIRNKTGHFLKTEDYPNDFEYASRAPVIQRAKKIRGDKCEICGWDKATVDGHHILPTHKGGKNVLQNIILLCPNDHRLVEKGIINL